MKVLTASRLSDGAVVYLAKASQENMGNGPVIAATNIDLNTYTGDETLWVISPGGAPP